jgi:hypothetical protein
LPAGQLTNRRSYVGRSENRCRDLIQKGLKNVVVSPIYQNDIDIRAFQSAGGGNATEPSSENYDFWPLSWQFMGSGR